MIILAQFSLSHANNIIIDNIKIIGAKRLSETFILNFLPDYPNTKYNEETLNKFTKNLYKSGMFNKISLNINNSTLLITVEEYPIINEVFFTGNDLLDNDSLSKIVSINPRDIFNKNDLNDSIEKIKKEYQKIGRYLAEINIRKTEISEGRVNLKFVINEGILLVVKNINFEGMTGPPVSRALPTPADLFKCYVFMFF